MSIIEDFTSKLMDEITIKNPNWFYKKHAEKVSIICFDDDDLRSIGIYTDSRPSQVENIVHSDDIGFFDFEEPSTFSEDSFICRLCSGKQRVVVCQLTPEKVDTRNYKGLEAFRYRVRNARSLLKSALVNNKDTSINFRSMLELTDDFIFFKDRNHVYTATSQSMADVTGFNRGAEHVGLTVYDLFPKEHADKYYQLEQEVYENKRTYVADIQPFCDQSGKTGWINNRKYPIIENDQVVGIFGIARIVTQEVDTDREKTQTLKELTQKNIELEHIASTDALTGMYNRVRFDKELEAELRRAKRYQGDLSLIMVDVDHFKRINDLYGHQVGDTVLTKLSHVLRENLRRIDVMGRWGGEEFVVIVPQTEFDNAVSLAEKLRVAIEEYNFPEVVNITASFGVTSYKKGDTADALLKRADTALYEAKKKGRNRVEVEFVATTLS